MAKSIRCSRYLWFLTYFMLSFPIGYLSFTVLFFQLDMRGFFLVLLAPLFYLSSIFWIITGVGIRKMKHWSWYTFLFAQFFVTYLNALTLANHSTYEFKGRTFIVTLFIQLYAHLVVSRELRVPYFFPRIKWWESGLAGMPHLRVEIFHLSSPTGTSIAQLLDMSPKGCFIKSPSEFEDSEKIKIKIEAFGQHVDVPGTVVWKAQSTVTHPKGIGIQFGNLDRTKRRKIRIVSKRFFKQKEARDTIHVLPAKSA